MGQIGDYVSGLGISLDALERRPATATPDLLERLCSSQRVVSRPSVLQPVQHWTLDAEEIASPLDAAGYGLAGHAKNGGVGGSFSREFKK